MGSSAGRVKQKIIKLVIVPFPIKAVRAKSGWLGIRIMVPGDAIYLSVNCCFSELTL